MKFLFLLSFISLVYSHGLITAIHGANGKSSTGFGTSSSVSRTTADLRDTPVFRSNAGPCGTNQLDGNINTVSFLNKAISKGLPSASISGFVNMVLHQVNADGAGPFTCQLDTTGTGRSFRKINVTKNVPGKDGRSTAKNKNFDLVAQLPKGTVCKGKGGACLIRCTNPNGFGSCVAVKNSSKAKRTTLQERSVFEEAAEELF